MVFGPTLSTLHQGPFIAGRFWRWKIQRHGLKIGRGPPCSFCSHFPAKFRFLLEYPSALSQAPVPPIEVLLCVFFFGPNRHLTHFFKQEILQVCIASLNENSIIPFFRNVGFPTKRRVGFHVCVCVTSTSKTNRPAWLRERPDISGGYGRGGVGWLADCSHFLGGP